MKTIPTWLVFVVGSVLLVGGFAYGVTHAFPAPDYSEEEAQRFHVTWSYLKYPIFAGLLLIALSAVLAVARGDPEKTKE